MTAGGNTGGPGRDGSQGHGRPWPGSGGYGWPSQGNYGSYRPLAGGYPPAGGYGSMRATDADRAKAQDVLQAAYADGRLTWEEFDSRTNRLLQAQTYDQLTLLTGDLTGQLVFQPYAAAPVRRGTNAMAIASLVCGIGQFPFWLLGTIPAIIFGHMARRQIRQTGEGGDGLAVAGLILGWAGAALTALLIAVAAIAVVASAGGAAGQ